MCAPSSPATLPRLQWLAASDHLPSRMKGWRSAPKVNPNCLDLAYTPKKLVRRQKKQTCPWQVHSFVGDECTVSKTFRRSSSPIFLVPCSLIFDEARIGQNNTIFSISYPKCTGEERKIIQAVQCPSAFDTKNLGLCCAQLYK